MKTNENPEDDYQKRIEDYGPEAEKKIEDFAAKANDNYQERIEDLSEKEEALMYDNGPESPEERHANGAVKGVAWLFGIVAVFAVAILLTWLIGGRAPINDRSADRQTYAYSQKAATIKAQPATSAEKANAKFMAALAPAKGAKSNAVSASAGKTSTATSGSASSSASMSKADMDRIEIEAREVIHGDFGNNPGRKAKLGADYAAVQARVNQILH